MATPSAGELHTAAAGTDAAGEPERAARPARTATEPPPKPRVVFDDLDGDDLDVPDFLK